MNWRWLLLIPLVYGAWDHWKRRPLHYPPGILVSAQPRQPMLERNGYRIQPPRSLSIEARVLGVASSIIPPRCAAALTTGARSI